MTVITLHDPQSDLYLAKCAIDGFKTVKKFEDALHLFSIDSLLAYASEFPQLSSFNLKEHTLQLADGTKGRVDQWLQMCGFNVPVKRDYGLQTRSDHQKTH